MAAPVVRCIQPFISLLYLSFWYCWDNRSLLGQLYGVAVVGWIVTQCTSVCTPFVAVLVAVNVIGIGRSPR